MSYHVLHYRLKKLKRSFLIWITLISLLLNLWIDNIRFTIFQTKNNEKSRVQIKRARWFTNQLIELGSAFIKIGQLLSARPDLIPNTWIQELSKLQDQVPNFSFAQVEETIRNELGSKFNEIDQIIYDPVGSASLAQVHRATLKDGKKVVFKVQRPNLKELFIIDLGIMQQIAGLLQKNKNWSRGRNWVEIAKECRKVLMKELDFNCEAQYAARFRQQFLDDENVEVPEVIWDMSSEKVLCLSYVEGTKISDLEKLKSQEIDLSKIAEIGAISYLKQLVNYGFFHADPHPGNLAVSSEGKLIFYDFGMMGNISNNLQTRLGGMVKAAALRDASSLVSQLQQAGLISKDIDVGPVRRLVRLMLKEALTPPFSPNIIEKLSGDLYELVYETPFQLPVDLIFVMRALSTFEGVGRMLDPGFNLVSVTKPYLIELMTSNNQSPNDLINQFGRQVGELGSKAVGIPKRIDESLERLEQGDLQLQIRMGESDRQFKKMFTAQKTLGHSILIGSLSIASALLVTNKQNNFALLPLFFALPISIDWIKCQLSMRKGSRLEKLKR
ncbi:AarF/ABC1/UbiB kinase family protein [Prochlorococcus marinus XMU1414]|uniref:AarF/ABC1/UbiB kinase family protein n=1 Tax=Prochlorococcus marinus XMU1424 TaxID=2774497 RepID=A0A9D9BZY9_PROMR|nr:AarF/ABC1/UbiB kinase family protein [Prochlorococcus marinus]MBO8227508.1 AarF/ABC1/UbiB kinase family protein [Prochlorococcus marinus XMU1414]MBW3045022.1 kinase [Prochlorococcus marinus str. MU1414]MCR8532713.1 AarF/ABC1/UbiB kinase family protein [Prochlorococcus marinus XMU1420]MCR8536462.1 AarF/ABC1/UbiB kinase family protein [Prochlorococcus marinus XMU1424]